MTTNASLTETEAILNIGKTWERAEPVTFDFSKYNVVEHNYPVYDQEILTIIWALNE